MDRPDQPTEVDLSHDVIDRVKRLGHSGLVVKGHRKAGCKLDNEANQRDASQTVKNVDVRGNKLTGGVVHKGSQLQPLVKPVINL